MSNNIYKDLKTSSNSETPKLNELLPLQIRQNSRTFIEFIEDYYRFLNEENNPSYVIQRIIDEHDLDKVFDEKYLDRIKYEIANNAPNSPYVQKAFLLKRIVDYYDVRGSEESLKFFFRVFFGEDIDIYHPWSQVLIPSNGKWLEESLMNVVLYQGDENTLFDKVIQQFDDLGRVVASARVKSVFRRVFLGKTYFVVKLRERTITGEFDSRMPFRTLDRSTFGYPIRSLSQISIKSTGQNYQLGDLLFINSKNDNTTFKAIVTKINETGGVTKVRVVERGFSSNFIYPNTIPTDITDNLVKVYLSGIEYNDPDDPNDENGYIKVDGDGNFYITIQTIDEGIKKKIIRSDRYDLADYVGPINFNIEGITTTNGILVEYLTSYERNNIYHDYVNYDLFEEIDYSFDPKPLDNVIIETENGNGVEFEFSFKPIIKTSGIYEQLRGDPSGFDVIQDSFYYQVFSYEILSSLSFKEFKDEFESFIHPTGMMPFNKVRTVLDSNVEQDITSTFFVNPDFAPPAYSVYDSVPINESFRPFSENYTEDYYFGEDYVGVNLFIDNETTGFDYETLQFSLLNNTLSSYQTLTKPLFESFRAGQTYHIKGMWMYEREGQAYFIGTNQSYNVDLTSEFIDSEDIFNESLSPADWQWSLGSYESYTPYPGVTPTTTTFDGSFDWVAANEQGSIAFLIAIVQFEEEEVLPNGQIRVIPKGDGSEIKYIRRVENGIIVPYYT